MIPSEGIRYLRYGREPSIFQIPDDLEGQSTAVEAFALELEPRVVDEGWLSVWKASTEAEQHCLMASYAARRPNRQSVIAFCLPEDILNQAGVTIESQPDRDTFDCVASLHYGLSLADPSIRKTLGEIFVEQFRSGTLSPDKLSLRVTKGELISLLKIIYERCCRAGQPVDLEKAAPWAQAAVMDSTTA